MLIKRHKLKIYNFIYSKVFDRDTAEDIFQETLQKSLGPWSEVYITKKESFYWVMRIAHNLVIDFSAKQSHSNFWQQWRVWYFPINWRWKPGRKSHDRRQVVEDLQNLIVKLPEDQKDVLTMRLYKDMSFKEIAESTGVSINTALGRMLCYYQPSKVNWRESNYFICLE